MVGSFGRFSEVLQISEESPNHLHNGYTSLYSKQCTWVPFPPHSNQCLFFHLWIIDIVTGMKWKPTVIFISISLMASDPKHLCACLFFICFSSFEKSLFISLTHFLTILFALLLERRMSSYLCLQMIWLSKWRNRSSI